MFILFRIYIGSTHLIKFIFFFHLNPKKESRCICIRWTDDIITAVASRWLEIALYHSSMAFYGAGFMSSSGQQTADEEKFSSSEAEK